MTGCRTMRMPQPPIKPTIEWERHNDGAYFDRHNFILLQEYMLRLEEGYE